ncbi:hypothetical protein [Actinophytocola sp.]|uniref:hypothetical protein n=1 Tax=Actinophytocola sp. TaxID=1872138 RepID=UPI002ED5115D
MSTEQTDSTTEQPAVSQQPTAEWGAPPPPAAPRSKWTVKRTLIAVVVAVGIAGAGGAAIYAASGSVDNTQGGGPGGMRGGPGGGPGQMIVGGPMGGDVQHGEFQTGEVTAISDDSITVKSEDDYEQTYVIDDNTQVASGIAEGDQVTVIATTENDKATAETVMEFGNMPGGGTRRDGTNGGNGTPPSGGNTPPSNAPNGGN